jgi:hypothetical protein
MSEESVDSTIYLLCAEYYRNREAQYDVDDYYVEGMVLLHLPLRSDIDASLVESTMKQLVLQLLAEENREELVDSFPKFSKMLQDGGLFWFHLMRKEHKERLPQDFHSNAFTEEELLGIAPIEEELPREFWFDRDGDPLEGPPDRLMGLLWGS